jgi:uncharacterized protein (UPF0216 family)
MSGELPYDRILREYLTGELRVLNAHLPGKQKSLADLWDEEYPHVLCNDGSAYLFKRKELRYLASLIDIDERKALLLPILIEVNAGRGEMAVLCLGEVDKKVIQKVLDMPLDVREGRITIYRPQLALVRKRLKTTTQYIFSPQL